MSICVNCEGRKIVIIPAKKSPFGIAIEVNCPECKGTGETGNLNACPNCNDSRKSMINISGIPIEVNCPDCSKTEINVQ